MKRYNIFTMTNRVKALLLLCLLMATTAMAQSGATYRLRVNTLPQDIFFTTIQVYETAETNKYGNFTGNRILQMRNDTTDIDIQVPAGAGIQLNVSTNNGASYTTYKLVDWRANGLVTEIRANDEYGRIIYWTMPDHDVDLLGTYEFVPENPGESQQPVLGSWDPETGTLIVEGRSGRMPPGFTNNEENRAKVLRYIRISDGYANNGISLGTDYPNRVYADLSRTNCTYVTCKGSWDGSVKNKIVEIVLPATITQFEPDAFKGTELQTMILYALTPPACGKYIWNSETNRYDLWGTPFPDCPNMVVRVPAEAVSLYQADEHWSAFNIVAMDADYVNLTVQLMANPVASTIAKYKNMSLVLTDKKSGQTRRYIIDQRNEYEFRYLPTNSTYDVVLCTTESNEIARIDNIYLDKENKTVTFDELKTPRTLTLSLLGSDSQPVDEELYTITWMKGDGTYLKRGNTMENVIDDQHLLILPTIGAELAKLYAQPDTVSYTVGQDADYNIALLLPVQPVTTATFTAIDSLTHRPISGVTVDVAQVLFNGETGTRSLLTTGSDGMATGQVLATMSTITMTSPQHGSLTFNANLADSTAFRRAFIEANGTTILLNHTYQAAVKQNETPVVENYYSEGRSLEYTFTATLPDGRDSVMTDYLLRYPMYTFYNTLPVGTKVRVSAVSTKDDIEPVEAEGTVGEQATVSVTLPIVQRGSLHVDYERAESINPAALLFNATTGQLVKKQVFGDRTFMTFENLPAGDYLVAAMSKGPQYLSVNSRTQLEQYVKDKDYVAELVTIGEGRNMETTFQRVPITMTQLETNLTQRRATCDYDNKVGYYSGIDVQIAFKGDLKERTYGSTYDESKYPTDCKLEVYLPEGFTMPGASCSYRYYYYWPKGKYYGYQGESVSGGSLDELMKMDGVSILGPGSIYMHSTPSKWNVAERKLTVDWPHYDEGGKMHIYLFPTSAGTFTPEVYLVYKLGGKEYREVLETNMMTVSKSGIAVPETVVTEGFKVKGTAMYYEPEAGDEEAAAARMNSSLPLETHSTPPPPPYYEVTVMDDGTPIGKAQIKKDGTWLADCKLVNPTTNSKHNIYAVIKPSKWNDFSYQTECKTVTYDPNAVVPLWTKMTFFNHHPMHLVETSVYFDYVSMKASPESYGYSNEEGYNTDFTFEVNLSNNDTTKVYACALHIWTDGPDGGEVITMAHYNARKGHWIAYEKFNTQAIPNSVYVEPFYYVDVVGSREMYESSNELLAQLTKRPNDGSLELEEKLRELLKQGDEAYKNGQPVPIDEIISVGEQLDSIAGIDSSGITGEDVDVDKLLEEAKDLTHCDVGNVITDAYNTLADFNDLVEGFNITTVKGETESSLLEKGYEALLLDDGSSVFVLVTDNGDWSFVDLKQNLKIEMNNKSASRLDMRHAPEEWPSTAPLDRAIELLQEAYGHIANNVELGFQTTVALIDKNNAWLKSCEAALKNTNLSWAKVLALNTSKLAVNSTLATLNVVRKGLEWIKNSPKIGGLVSLYSLITDMLAFEGQLKEMNTVAVNMLAGMEKCEAEREEFRALFNDCQSFTKHTIKVMATALTIDFASLMVAYGSIAAAPESAGWTIAGAVAGLISSATAIYTAHNHAYRYEKRMPGWKNECAMLWKACNKRLDCKARGDCPKCVSDGSCPTWPRKKKGPYPPTTEPTLDPSGFVYEGVESNRLEGVTTTVFYKTTEKNLFGEEVEKVTIWDAERYNQINPQLTDENGEYGWMVPTGWWQVKYEKDGYQTEYSEWLPVPPPQLDVNQPMTSIAQPMVSDVKATTQAVTVTFDKYMLADSLTDARIFVTRNGQKVSGTLDKLVSDDDPMQSLRPLTNKVRFMPTTALPAGQKLTLTVKGDVPSYAGVEMGNDFSQEFDIKATVEKIVADSTINVLYDQGTALTLQAQPAAAAAGKKVKARILSDMIASINQNENENHNQKEVTLDSQGKATIVITGEAHGTTALILEMADDADIQTVVTVTVREQGDFVCPMPVSDYQPSQAYPAGTQISLSCSLPGATILYTTDGSCPCSDGNNVITYTGPITLMADMVIKAIARAPGYEDSDIAELTFMVEGSGSDTPVTYQLVVADAGYATFYDSQRAYQMPAGLTASTVSGISGGRLSYQQLSGSIIPQATAVLIEAQQKQAATYTLTSTVADGSAVSTNLLHGSDNATTTDAGQEDAGGYLFYKLAYGPSNTSLANSFGWFWGAQQGAPFSIEGHRAWLAVPKQAGARAYLISGESADIQYVELPQQQSGQVTDLQGRRLDKPTQPGIYIKDGRKVVVGGCGLRPK